MSFQRLALIAGWLIISLLAVAGFATFSAANVEVSQPVAIDSDIGRNAGAVAALAFSHTTVTGSVAPVTTIDFDLAIQKAIENRASAPPTVPAIVLIPEARSTSLMSESDVRALIERYFKPEDVNRAIRIAWCESSFDPRAVNPTSGAAGLFQHLPQFWANRSAKAGWPGADVFEPEANVAVAAWLLYEFPGTWEHWTCKA